MMPYSSSPCLIFLAQSSNRYHVSFFCSFLAHWVHRWILLWRHVRLQNLDLSLLRTFYVLCFIIDVKFITSLFLVGCPILMCLEVDNQIAATMMRKNKLPYLKENSTNFLIHVWSSMLFTFICFVVIGFILFRFKSCVHYFANLFS